MILSGKKERKKERHLKQGNGKMKNESCLRWDSNLRHTVLQTDALPTECTCTYAQCTVEP